MSDVIPIDPGTRIGHAVVRPQYVRDPDRNGVELYWDRPREQWPATPHGSLAMGTQLLDLDDLLRVAVSLPDRHA